MAVRAVFLLALLAGVRASVLDRAVDALPDALCKTHVQLWLQEFANYTNWALRMADATGKLSPAILSGNIRSLGYFDECLEIRASNLDATPSFRGKYCIANLHVDVATGDPREAVLSKALDATTSGRRHLEITRRRNIHTLYPSVALFEWAVCVPSSCSASDVQVAVNAVIQEEASRHGFVVDALVTADTCYTDHPVDYQPMDYVMICFLLVTFVVLVAATVLDYIFQKNHNSKTNPNIGIRIVRCFSLSRNWAELTDVSSGSGTITCLDGVRVLSTAWVIMTHKVLFMSQEPWINKYLLMQSTENFMKMPLLNSMLNVDTFFVVSGLLRALSIAKELDSGRFNFFNSLLQRYIRLTPVYMVMVAFYSSLLQFASSGPYWNKYVTQNVNFCKHNWLLNLIYVNNYVHSEEMCMIQSWYLAADMQLFLVSPLLVYALWRWRRLGKAVLALFVLGGTLLRMVTIFFFNYPGIYHVGLHDNDLHNYLSLVYLPTHNRMSSYFIGIGLGYVLYKMKDKKLQIPKIVNAAVWVVSFVMLFGVVYGPFNLMKVNAKYKPFESSLYGALHRPVWAAAVAWIIFACHKGYGGIVNRILSCAALRPLSRLSYCMYLTHYAYQLVNAGRIRTELYMDEYMLCHNFAGDLAMVTAFSLFLYMCFEAPSLALARIIFGKSQRSSITSSKKSEEPASS